MQALEISPTGREIRMARLRAGASYRNFQIAFERRGTIYVGTAYAGKIASFHAAADTLDAVESDLRKQIDADLRDRINAAISNGWTEDDYLLAMFLVSPILSPVQTHLIKRLAETAGKPVTLEQLRWPSIFSSDAVERSLVRLSKMLTHALYGAQENAPIEDGLKNMVDGDVSQPWLFHANLVAAAGTFTEMIH
jgi:hypothetical protein